MNCEETNEALPSLCKKEIRQDTKEIRTKALDLLARREHSALELKRKLLSRGYELDKIEIAIASLQRDGLQSDERFVECYARTRSTHGFGPQRIKAELNQRGITDELIQSYIDENAEIWLKSLQQVCEKKFGTKRSNDINIYVKQINFLKYRGFTNQQIKMITRGKINFDEE